MIYAMSDLHGCYDKYIKMLDKIELSENDILYILGDVVDRGEDGIKILLDMQKRQNIVPLLGNHDYMAFMALKPVVYDAKPSFWEQLREDWLADGGAPTEKAFMELCSEEQKRILGYIMEFSVYETLDAGGREFVLTHAGIENYSEDKGLHEYELYEFITGRMDYGKPCSSEFHLVSGHTPTGLIDAAYNGRIYQKNNHIAIDCGAVFGQPLGCICLDTLEEFYVK